MCACTSGSLTSLLQGIDRKRLAKLSVECYLEQLLTYGFFHAGGCSAEIPLGTL